MSAFIAVDPGKSGAVAVLTHEGTRIAYRDFVNEMEIAEAIQDAVCRIGRDRLDGVYSVVENVHSMPKQGVASSFSFGFCTGVAVGALKGFGLPVMRVEPSVWQRWTARTTRIVGEFDSRKAGTFFWPGQETLFKRVKDHNTGDAVCMVEWLQEEILGAGAK